MKSKLVLLVKGFLMGLADVVPGVSGGTLALVLGIYVEFIEAIKSINVRWIPPLGAWIRSGFRREGFAAVMEPILAVHWGFLIPLALGIASAFAVGARIIPDLMEAYPTGMRAFFFGLVLASCLVPYRSLQRRGVRELAFALVFGALTFVVVGSSSEPVTTWKAHVARESMTLEEFTRRFPSLHNPEELYCPTANPAHDNGALRSALGASSEGPSRGADLDRICAELAAARTTDLVRWAELRKIHHLDRKDPKNPFSTAVVPAGTEIRIPTPAYWFVFVAGVVAICAMVLPGISGSFILLVLGAYYFMLSSLKGMFGQLRALEWPAEQFAFVVVFSLGCLIGITTFSRFLSWLFRRWSSTTLAALIGVMIGSLRVIWPWKEGDTHTTVVVNVLPEWSAATGTHLALAVGAILLVSALTFVGERLEGKARGLHTL